MLDQKRPLSRGASAEVYLAQQLNPKRQVALIPGTKNELQMSLVSCAELPGEDACWATAHDAFSTASGKFEVSIQIVGSQITLVQ